MPTAVDGSTTIVPSSWARTADLEWRDRAIRAEALLDRLQVENQELRERIDALEAVKTKLEDENRTLYEQWDEWFQAQQQMGGSTRRGRSHCAGRSDAGYISRHLRALVLTDWKAVWARRVHVARPGEGEHRCGSGPLPIIRTGTTR